MVKFKVSTNHETATQVAKLLPAVGGTPSGNCLQDASQVADRIEALIKSLGLQQSLGDRQVGQEQIPLIVSRALGGEMEGYAFDAVTRLVTELY